MIPLLPERKGRASWQMVTFGDCKKGETSAKTGCTPASGEGRKKEGEEKQKKKGERGKASGDKGFQEGRVPLERKHNDPAEFDSKKDGVFRSIILDRVFEDGHPRTIREIIDDSLVGRSDRLDSMDRKQREIRRSEKGKEHRSKITPKWQVIKRAIAEEVEEGGLISLDNLGRPDAYIRGKHIHDQLAKGVAGNEINKELKKRLGK